jgi:hypothetical protein
LLCSASVKIRGWAAAVFLMACSVAAPAHAQVNSRFAAGADVSFATTGRSSGDDYAHGGVLLEPLWRFGTTDPGWGFHWGLNWYDVKVDRSIGGTVTELGEVKIRPIMAGYGYTWVRGRNTISANMLGGFAFASADMAPGVPAAYRARLGVEATDADASNGFVAKPEVDFWHDINKLFGLNINVGYMLARPDVTVTTSTGIDRRTVRADQFLVKVGLVYSFF